MKNLSLITTAVALIVSLTPSNAQIENRSGWSQSDGYGGTYGQTRDGTSWREQSNGYGGSTYTDTKGRSCWSQSNGYGSGSFTSCN